MVDDDTVIFMSFTQFFSVVMLDAVCGFMMKLAAKDRIGGVFKNLSEHKFRIEAVCIIGEIASITPI